MVPGTGPLHGLTIGAVVVLSLIVALAVNRVALGVVLASHWLRAALLAVLALALFAASTLQHLAGVGRVADYPSAGVCTGKPFKRA